jgi:hypothetical protein
MVSVVEYWTRLEREDTLGIWLSKLARSQKEADEWAADWIDDPLNRREIRRQQVIYRGIWEVDLSYRCLDCGIDTSGIDEYPLMLADKVWYSIVPGGAGMLCQKHMQDRLGRELTRDDLLMPETFLKVAERSRVLREARLLLGLPTLGKVNR